MTADTNASVVPEDALVIFESVGADLLLLDLNLPGLPGIETFRRLRNDSCVPVIMVTGKDSEVDRIVGLEIGADDYVTKPFSPRELMARIRAVLRRQAAPVATGSGETLRASPVRMDTSRHEVTVRGVPVKLPLKEYRLLEILLRNAGLVLTRARLIETIWGTDYVGDTKTLDVHIKRLRARIEPTKGQQRHIVTLRGLGYKFEKGEGRSDSSGGEKTFAVDPVAAGRRSECWQKPHLRDRCRCGPNELASPGRTSEP